MGKLLKKLEENSIEGRYPFHMPGHKRNCEWNINPYAWDITEIEGFDNLHNPKGIIREVNEEAASIYGADHAIMLVNGSSSGILTAISALCPPGSRLLMARNSHKSAYNGVFLRELEVSFVFPPEDGKMGISGPVLPDDVEKVLANDGNIRAVFITSPTYEGVVSDIKEIAGIAHRHGIPLIVDGAHGAHLGFDPFFPENPTRLGADIVIMSLHKTLPALTQTAVLCVNDGLVDFDKILKYADIYTTTSPSYLLMASVDRCLDMLRDNGKSMFDEYGKELGCLRRELGKLKKLKLYEPEWSFDPGKIVIGTAKTDIFGTELAGIVMEKYGLEPECALRDYVIFMTSCCDSGEGFNALLKALSEIDGSLGTGDRTPEAYYHEVQCKYTMAEAETMETEYSELESSEGKICGEIMYIYPPGTPILLPGEYITDRIINTIGKYIEAGLEISGLCRGKIKVIKNG